MRSANRMRRDSLAANRSRHGSSIARRDRDRAGTQAATIHGMTDHSSSWNDVRRLADELELRIHLAGMDARDRWHELEPRLEKLEHQIAQSGERAEDAVVRELHEVGDELRALRDDIQARARGDFLQGW